MVSELLKQAIQLAQAGNKLEARDILKRILVEEPTNETAWLWFIDSLPTDHERVIALEGLRRINPESRVARIGLAEYRRREESHHLPVPKQSASTDEFIPQEQQEMVDEEDALFDGNPDRDSYHLGRSKPVDFSRQEDIEERSSSDHSLSRKKPGKKRSPIAKLFILGFLIFALLIIIGSYLASAGWASRIPVLKIFISSTASPCTCSDADAYLVRVKARLQRWKTNQSIYELDQAGGMKPASVEFARGLLAEEKLENPPECLKTVHDLSMMLLEYHLEFGLKLMEGVPTEADFYKKYVQEYQSQLADEFQRLAQTYKCTP